MGALRFPAWIVALPVGVVLASCGSSERNVISERAPFYTSEVPFDEARIDTILTAVRAFSARHQMDYLVARESLGVGEFNVSANSAALNLKAFHTGSVNPGNVIIAAISRSEPTNQDKALADEFVKLVREVGQ